MHIGYEELNKFQNVSECLLLGAQARLGRAEFPLSAP